MKGERTAGAISTPQMYFTFWLTENKQFEFDLIVQKGTSDYYWAIRLLLNKNSETVCQIFLFFSTWAACPDLCVKWSGTFFGDMLTPTENKKH